jgi:putative membrane protein
MKKIFSFAICFSALAFVSCNNSSDGEAMNADTSNSTVNSDTAGTNANNNTTANTPATPLSKEDSNFVIEAAIGGMMEVDAGNLAQQNANNQRVKDFGGMMVTDHSKANNELQGLASSHGISLPAALPADKQKHLDAMKKMTGKAFDKHYMDMMVNDHKKTIDKFKMASEKCDDANLKSWASQTLPTLQKHMDSAQAVKKGM